MFHLSLHFSVRETSTDLRFQLTRLNASKCLTERQIANDVKSQDIEPLRNVQTILRRSSFTNHFDEPIYGCRNQRLLLDEGPLGKGMRKQFSHSTMYKWTSFANNRSTLVRKAPAFVEIAFDKWSMALPEVIDISP